MTYWIFEGSFACCSVGVGVDSRMSLYMLGLHSGEGLCTGLCMIFNRLWDIMRNVKSGLGGEAPILSSCFAIKWHSFLREPSSYRMY